MCANTFAQANLACNIKILTDTLLRLNCYNIYFNILKHHSHVPHAGEFFLTLSQGRTRLKFTHAMSKETGFKENIYISRL